MSVLMSVLAATAGRGGMQSCYTVVYTPGGFALSDTQQIVLTSGEYVSLRVPSCTALVLYDPIRPSQSRKLSIPKVNLSTVCLLDLYVLVEAAADNTLRKEASLIVVSTTDVSEWLLPCA